MARLVKMAVVELIPIDWAVRKMVHDIVLQNFVELCSELEDIDRDIAEKCCGSDIDCKFNALRIAYETVLHSLRDLLEEALKEEWETIIKAYEDTKKAISTRYIT